MYYPVWYTGSPEAHSGQTYHKKLGRINSWPDDYDTYSTWRLQTDFYISGVSEATHWENIRATMGAFAGAASQVDMGAGQEILEDQWVTFDTRTTHRSYQMVVP